MFNVFKLYFKLKHIGQAMVSNLSKRDAETNVSHI